MKEVEKDIAHFTQLIEDGVDVDIGYRHRGAAYIFKNENERGLRDINKAKEINPSYDNFYQSGWSNLSIGRFSEAIKDFSRLVEIDAVQYNSLYSRGWAYLKSGDFQNSILDFSELIKLNHKEYEPYSSRGYAYEKAGHYEESIADYTTAINLGDAYSFLSRAAVYAKVGNQSKAITDYKEFLKLSQDTEMVDKVKQEINKLK